MSRAFTPGDREDLASWLATCDERVTVHGSHPRGVGPEVLMSSLHRLVLYEPGEMIVQVEAGMRIQDLNQILTAQGQWIPNLVSDEDPSTTVGGALSLDIRHPRSRTFMSLRTAVLGGTFCTTDGELFKSGSRVVKSVAGYDTHRAFVGAEGKLGVIVEVTLRVLPLPETIFRGVLPVGFEAALAAEDPSVLEVQDDTILFELCGYQEDVAGSIDRLDGLPVQRISEDEWYHRIRELRSAKTKRRLEGNAQRLFASLQVALDPKGVLR